MLVRVIPILLLAVAVLGQAQAQELYPSKAENYVTDEAGVLTGEEEDRLNRMLKAYEDSTTNQYFVLTLASLQGEDGDQLANKIFR